MEVLEKALLLLGGGTSESMAKLKCFTHTIQIKKKLKSTFYRHKTYFSVKQKIITNIIKSIYPTVPNCFICRLQI